MLPPRLLGLLVWAACLAPAASARPEADEFDREPRPAETVRADGERALLELADSTEPTSEALLEALATLDPELVPALCEALDERAAGRAVELEPGRRAALRRALAGIPAAVRARDAGGETELAPDRAQRDARAALAVLGAWGVADDLPLAFELATPRPASERVPRDLLRALEDAAGAILARERGAHARLQACLPAVDPRLRASAVRAVGEAGTREGLELLGELLGADPALELAVFSQINRVSASVRPPHDWSFVARVRTYLGDPDASLRREAAIAVGRLEDLESVPELLPMLMDEAAGARENALWSLRVLSGRDLGRDPRRWKAWIDSERAWWRTDARALLDALDSTDERERIEALGALSSHRLYRHELARELAWFLPRPDSELVRVVCSALASLRSPVAVTPLVDLLKADDEEVRRSAWLALRAITGRDLPESHAAWVSAVG